MAGRVRRKQKAAVQEPEADATVCKRIRPEEETDGLGVAEDGLRAEVESLYRLHMPRDFYHFWTFCQHLHPHCPQDALCEALGLRLVGPYDILAGKHKHAENPQPNFLLHWRHFFDPPEFQTIIVGLGDNQMHMGYYRDCPDSLPVFIGENEAKRGCCITQMGDNVFSAVLRFLQRKKDRSDVQTYLETKLRSQAEAQGYSLEQKTKGMRLRGKGVVSQTFHGAGIVVPVDKNDVGYRELPETDAALRRICKAIADAETDDQRMKAFGPIQEMLTYVQFANDECDYGMGYELGIDLFCYGSHYLHKVVGQLLPLAYSLLHRGLFGEILQTHLSHRRWEKLDQLQKEQ